MSTDFIGSTMVRRWVRGVAVGFLWGLGASSFAGIPDIGTRRELFLDDAFLVSVRGLEWRMHLPEAREVVLTCDAAWEGNTSAYFTVLEEGGLYRMYYRGSHFDEKSKRTAHPEYVCYAESRDGIRWVKPELGLVEIGGSTSNNVVLKGGEGEKAGEVELAHNFTPFLDTNPSAPKAERFKALAGIRTGLTAYVSGDGVNWRKSSQGAVIRNGAFDSQNLAFWDVDRGEYRAYWRIFTAGVADAVTWKPSGVRTIRTAVSKDFVRWEYSTDLRFRDAPQEQLYTNAVRPYGRAPHVFIGFPTRYQSKTQQVEPVLMSSRDGVEFKRWPEAVIPISAPQDRDGNRSNYMANAMLELPGAPGEISVYATEAYYKGPGSRLRRFVYRADGFVSLRAGEKEGEAVSGHFTMAGGALSVNAKLGAGGALRVELQDAAGRAYPGFSLEDSVPFGGDSVEVKVGWKGGSDVSSLKGKPLRVRWVIQKGDLYSFRFE